MRQGSGRSATRRAGAPTAVAAALLAVLLALPPAAGAQTAPPPEEGTLAALGYGDTALRGTYGSADLFVPLPAGARGTGATVVLDLRVSPLLVDRSTLTVLAGGVEVGSLRLSGGDPAPRLQVDVPAERIGDTGLALGLRGYLRLTEDECEEADNPAQWVTVLATSTVDLDLERTDPVLADLPALFAGPPDDAPVAIALPDDPEGAELEVAAAAAWQIGRWRGARGVAAVVARATDDLDRDVPLVAVGLAGRLADAAPELALEPVGGALAVTNRVAPALVVTAADGEGLADAAAALADPPTLATLRQDQAVLTGELAQPAPDASAAWSGERTTLAQLGFERQVVTGTGVREIALRIDRPPGWTVRRDVEVELHLDASSALDARTSTAQLLVAGVDVGTRALGEHGVTRLRFTVPAGLVDRDLQGRPVRSLDLLLRMVLDLPEDRCSAPDPAAAAVALLPTSTLAVPHGEADVLELGRFPHPLEHPGREGRTTLVLPDGELAPEELDAALQAAAALGRWAGPGATAPAVARVGELEGGRPEGAGGLLVVGDRAVEAIAPDAVPDRTPPAAAAQDAVLAVVGDVAGGPAVLLDGGGPGLVAAARALVEREVLRQADGSVAVVQAGVGDPAAVPLGADAGAPPPPELAPPDPSLLRSRPDHLVPALVLGGVLLALLLLVVVFRWGPGRRRRARAGDAAPAETWTT
jgi:cellulose synthase operon protein B